MLGPTRCTATKPAQNSPMCGSRKCIASEPWFNLVHLEGKPRDYAYTLRGWIRNLKSNEASLKYFLMGAFSTGLMLMGIALIASNI